MIQNRFVAKFQRQYLQLAKRNRVATVEIQHDIECLKMYNFERVHIFTRNTVQI